MPIPDLFNKLTKAKNHLALVVDEYGGTNGVVSMEDIVGTLLGLEIMDEVDKVEDMQQYARGYGGRSALATTPHPDRRATSSTCSRSFSTRRTILNPSLSLF